jgi:outer membrane lipoprotein-sorting protein
MGKILLLISSLLLVVNGFLYAQDPKAKEILDKVSQTNKSYQTIQIDFSFTLFNPKNKTTETNEGWVALKGKNYRLHMPALGVDVFSDGTATWSYLTESNEVNITENDPESDASLNPANLFTIYEKGFQYSLSGDENVDGKPASVIDLVPENKKKEYTKVRIFVDKTKFQIVKAIYYNKDGNTYTLVLKDMKTNQPIADDFFKFNPAKYPKVQVNDMR